MAIRLLRKMEKMNFEPNMVLYNTIIFCFFIDSLYVRIY